MSEDIEVRKTENGEETEDTENLKQVYEEWDQLHTVPVQDYIDKGFRPYKRIRGNYMYITLKKGKFEKSLGPYTEARWRLLMSMMPKKEDDAYLSRVPEKKPTGKTRRKNILGIKITKPSLIPTTFKPSLDTLYYYKLAQNYGYEGSFEDFINETVKAYFLRNGLVPGLILTVEEEGG